MTDSTTPITDELRKEMTAAEIPMTPAFESMLELLESYEYGEADVEDVAPGMTLEIYATVVQDIVWTLHFGGTYDH
jgi:hypothetical protein